MYQYAFFERYIGYGLVFRVLADSWLARVGIVQGLSVIVVMIVDCAAKRRDIATCTMKHLWEVNTRRSENAPKFDLG